MKLKLGVEKDVQILTASESLVPKDVQILRAGITQLLKNGKNRIALEVAGASQLSSDVLRELAMLDILARELSGRIVLVSSDPQIKTKILTFAKPPVIECFQTRAAAIQYLNPEAAKIAAALKPATAPAAPAKPGAPATTSTTVPPGSPTGPTTPAKPAPAASATPTAPPMTAPAPGAPMPPGGASAPVAASPPGVDKDAEIKQLKEQLRQKESGELGTLRKQLADLQAENNALKDQLVALVLMRRQPPDYQAYEAKIHSLETQLEQTISQGNKDQKKT